MFERIKSKVRNRLKEIKEESDFIRSRNKEIKKKSLDAALNEKEVQQIRLAQESQKIKADRKLNRIKHGGSGFFTGYSNNYGNAFGQPKQIGNKTIVKYVKYKGKGKKRRKIVTHQPVHSSYSFGGLVNNNSKFDVLGFGR
jgi:hypothetical protein